MKYLFNELSLELISLLFDNFKKHKIVFEYCPRGYIEGGYYKPFHGITAGIIRMRVLFEGGPYMRKYGNPEGNSLISKLALIEVLSLLARPYCKSIKQKNLDSVTLTIRVIRDSRANFFNIKSFLNGTKIELSMTVRY